MVKLIWALRALNDLNEIGDYISKDSILYAKNTINGIINSVKILKQFPKSGKVMPELMQDDIREISKGNYRIIYKLKDADIVEIITVHHTSKYFNPSNYN